MGFTRRFARTLAPSFFAFSTAYTLNQHRQAFSSASATPSLGIRKNVFIAGSGNTTRECLSSLAKEKIDPSHHLAVTLYNPNAEQKLEALANHKKANLELSRTDYLSRIQQADIVVIQTDPFPDESGRERDLNKLLFEKRAASLKDIASAVKILNSKATVILVSEQRDAKSEQFQEWSQHKPEKLLGFGGAIDSQRFHSHLRFQLLLHLDYTTAQKVHGYLIGYRNKDSFPLLNSFKVDQAPLDTLVKEGLISAEDLQQAFNRALARTRNLEPSKGSGHLLSQAILHLAFPQDNPMVAPFTVYIPEKSKASQVYEVSNSFFSVPVILQGDGTYSIVCDWELSPSEKLKAVNLAAPQSRSLAHSSARIKFSPEVMVTRESESAKRRGESVETVKANKL